MSNFKAKMHQIVCRLGLCPRLRWELTSLPIPSSRILGGLLRRGGEGTREKGRGGEGRKGQEGERGGEGRGGGWGREEGRVGPQAKAWPPNNFPGAGAVESAYWTSY